ncbi:MULTISPECIES: ABC transporter permease [unclassified Paracoccus (in: a-proteobacteria)]|uniref:ABC transporter permease n=1 Tax=unclassified Paracoccus (in: a-proteobacteria) TaxID=2688777 RepID=UPI001601A4DB|nr:MULTISPECIES: ABC transporter permease subunit [unclassified Paracoccus (in: a-proteobacteria)]MBB1491880.1 ABC transporter permease subunit [Paracoccus sp. MC1854]MBB1498257.1 ABC transporter permease subunit [Paracoccus sp. MC1862]QQO45744.1 ABC transporter permease subunit [Paracoccus sp. MC1862]
MNQCLQTISDYGLRSIGIGERLLPRSDFTLCQQFTLIGSGLIWNLYFAILSLGFGFVLANALALAKASPNPWLRKPAEGFIFVFRGSPLFIQFFLAYSALVLLPRDGLSFLGLTLPTGWLTRAWAGALIVLTLNTAAYSAQIFHGALRNVPKGDLEAADAYGLTGWKRFRRIVWPTMMRLAWPSYTNEAIFLFHATTLVFFSAFPAIQQKGDSLYYASYFADKTFNPFVAYPIVAGYFILLTLCLIGLFGVVNRRLNRHLPGAAKRLRYRPKLIR